MSACENCSTPSGLPIPVANKIQDLIQYEDWSPDWWNLAHTMRQRECEAVATGFSHRPYATPEWQWIWHARIYGITDFMLNGLYRIYACIFRGQLSDSETQNKFWLRPVSIKGTNLQKAFTGKPAFDTLTAMSVERNTTKGQRLSSAELLDIDSACLILIMDKKELSLVLLDFLSCFHFGSSCAPTRHSINSTHGQGGPLNITYYHSLWGSEWISHFNT